MNIYKISNNRLVKDFIVLLSALIISTSLRAQKQAVPIPSPKEHFGFNMGDDYSLATYSQTESYFKKLAASDRTRLVDIGLTEEGRHQYMLIVSSPENIKNLQKYREISEKLARADSLSEEEAHLLSEEGKAVVWIDGGLHATEVAGSHQLIETAWQLVSRSDKETTEILDNVIILLVNANPDGQELVSSWYMRNADPKKRRMNIPRLYQKYIGHDNNRDFYMLSMKETRNMSRQLYIEWFPQILYNHHQSGPAGSVLAGPPYRDPFNYVFDPLVVTGIDALGAAMNNRLDSEGKPGYTMRTGSTYSTWYNGGLRTTAYFHNIIGLLTEIIGNPTPMNIPLVPDRLLPNAATPNPVQPGEWHFRQSIDYSVSLNYAVLDYASRFRSELLFNIYRMGKNSIEKGSTDHWTVSPKIVEALKNAYLKDTDKLSGPSGSGTRQQPGQINQIPAKYYSLIFQNPLTRDARAYIIPSDQADFPTAIRFVNALIGSGIRVMKATSAFRFNNKTYPAGSFIIRCDQAFRPHILDMFEPQDHPNDLQYPGGPPIAPYDAAGWTLAFQMGISFDRITEKIEGPFEIIPYGKEQTFEIKQELSASKAGYLISPAVNNSFTTVNDLLRNGISVYRTEGEDSRTDNMAPGSFFIPYSGKAMKLLAGSASRYGVYVNSVNKRPSVAGRISPLRIALVTRYGGSMPAGWISWIFEQFHFPYTFIYAQNIDSGNLIKKYDVILFASDIVPRMRKSADTARTQALAISGDNVPAEYKGMTGNITSQRSLPQIRKFIEEGGIVITIGSSTLLAYSLDLPVKNALSAKGDNGSDIQLRNNEFYIPGSLLRTDVDSTLRDTWGMRALCYTYFENDPLFRLDKDAYGNGVKRILWYSGEAPLISGWALGQKHLSGGVAAFEAEIGKGRFYAFTPEITFRSQSQSTFKLLFNALYGFEKRKEKPGTVKN